MKTVFSLLLAGSVWYAPAQSPRLIIPTGHTDAVTSVACSPDGKYILTGSKDNIAKLWNRSGREIGAFTGHKESVRAVAFSPALPGDSLYVLTGSNDGTAKLWNLHQVLLRTFGGHTNRVTAVAFSPDGKKIVTGSRDNIARFWERSTGKPLGMFQHAGEVTAVAYSPDGKYIVTGSKDQTVRLWDPASGKLLRTLNHPAAVNAVAFSPGCSAAPAGSAQILTGCDDGTARLWDHAAGKVIKSLLHSGEIYSLAFSVAGCGKSVATGSSDGTVRLWNLSGETELVFDARHGDWAVNAVVFLPVANGEPLLLSCSEDRIANVWDMSGKIVNTLHAHSSPVNALACSPDGRYLLTGSEDTKAALWDMRSDQVRTFWHLAGVNAVAFSPAGAGFSILTGSADMSAKQWAPDSASGQAIRTFTGHRNEVTAVAFSPDGKSVLTGSYDQSAILWDSTGQRAQTFGQHSDAVRSVAFSTAGGKKLVLTGSDDGAVRVFDTKSGAVLHTILASSPVLAMAVSPNGESVLTGSYNGGCKLWELSGTPIVTIQAPYGDKVHAVAFSPAGPDDPEGGRFILTGSGAGIARLWDHKTEGLLHTFKHTDEIRAVAFSPADSGKTVLTGSKDGTVKIWDRKTGAEIATLISIDSSDWVVTTPSGLFDGSPRAMSQLYYVQGLEIVELDQMKKRYYEPGLLSRLMGLSDGNIRAVEDLGAKELALYPGVLEATLTGDKIRVRLEKRNGGIGEALVLLDGRVEVIADANAQRLESFEIDLSPYAKYFYPDSANHLSLVFSNAENLLQSPPCLLEYIPGGAKEKGDPSKPQRIAGLNALKDQKIINTLYALVVGTSDYTGAELDLRFPDQDAAAFKEALELAGSGLFGARMEIKLLNTAPGGVRPDRKAIRAALQEFAAKAEPKDVLLVFLSGHGATWPANSEDGQFYYLTAENNSFLFDDAQNRDRAIAQDSLQAWIRQVSARKRILILDACHSGQWVKTFEPGSKGASLSVDQRRALERMYDRSGFFVLAGSAADKFSYEDPRFGHGLLTYSLLRNIPMVAAGNSDRYVSVGELFQEVREDVPKLARELNKEQEPKLIGMEDFPIGIMSDTAQLVLPSTKKIIIRSSFSNKKRTDPLKFTSAINGELEKALYGPTLRFAFWPVNDAPGLHYFLNGEYEEDGKNIHVTAYFYRSDQSKERATFKASGKAAQPETVVDNLVNQLIDFLQTATD
ncbi:MAG: caspase family protein [Saprospirales bacterium]|nr:caspase family protein [Saprospirales bacterium]